MYDAAFSTEPCVTMGYSELEAYSEPCQYLLWEILFRTMCDPSIFKTPAYSESKAYS